MSTTDKQRVGLRDAQEWYVDNYRHSTQGGPDWLFVSTASPTAAPVDARDALLTEIRDYMWNPFEPDNQSRMYHKIDAALTRQAAAGEKT